MIKEVRQVLIACGLLLLFVFGVIAFASAQTIGKTKTEEFKADFEKKKDIDIHAFVLDDKIFDVNIFL